MARCLEAVGHGGRVIAIEWLPNIAIHLEESVFKNEPHDVIDVYKYAVADGKVSADTVNESCTQ